ncbi:hypothetical protein GGR58DRAFT_499016 [Xylaria digitata]|nr:hypothetical protein GGR58DRAFT_499016 [Xylaria digitata]
MAELPQLRDLHFQMANILTAPSLPSYSRAIVVIDEFAERVRSLPDPNSLPARALLHNCDIYKKLCNKYIRDLASQDSKHERKMYTRSRRNVDRSVDTGRKRRGVIFQVDRGDHVLAALEALRLEEFLEEQEHRESKRVRFTDYSSSSSS